MKLATLKGGRDGRLVAVSDDLARAADAGGVAATMQAAMDNWANAAPSLESLAAAADAGEAETFPFEPSECAAILPRACQWVDASAYLSHVELVRKARGAEMPKNLYDDPLMYQGASDSMIGPRDDIELADESWGIDMEAEVFVILDDVPMGVTRQAAARATSSWSAFSTTSACATSSPPSSARVSASFRASRRRHSPRSWRRRSRSAAPGTAPR